MAIGARRVTTRADDAKYAVLHQLAVRAADEPRAPSDVAQFVDQYYLLVPPEDLIERPAHDLCGAAVSHLRLAQRRVVGSPAMRVFNPGTDRDGWKSKHTVVQIVTDDMPFLVDSVSMELGRHGRGIHLVVQPVIPVRRAITGELEDVLPPGTTGTGVIAESFLHIELDRVRDAAELKELESDLRRVLGDVRAAVEDWPKMRARMLALVDELTTAPPRVDDDVAEVRELLRWIADDHYTFLGYRDYDLVTKDGGDSLKPRLGTGLGLLRDVGYVEESVSFSRLPASVRRKAREKTLLTLTKANSRSTVHRPSYLDYVGVKRFDEQGNAVGERRFLGLFTSSVYATSPREIPLVRRKVQAVRETLALPPGGHLDKALADVLESYPRDELFQANIKQLTATAIGVVHLQERQRVRLFVRPDTFGRFVSCLAYLPRDRYTTAVRLRIQRLLLEAYGGANIDYFVALSESVLVRIHFVVYGSSGELLERDVADLERRVAAATRSWPDNLKDALLARTDEARALELFDRYANAFPAAYQEDFTPAQAVSDIAVLERLDPAGDMATVLYDPTEAQSAAGAVRFQVFRTGDALAVSDLLPLLQNLGVRVLDERPYGLRIGGEVRAWIYDFGLAPSVGVVDVAAAGARFEAAFTAAWRGAIEDDGFNRLVLLAGLEWPDIVVLRAYARYLRQTRSTFSQSYVEDSLSNNPRIAASLVALFRARFDPQLSDGERDRRTHELEAELATDLDAVVTLDEDRILRSLAALIEATVRTNAYQSDADGVAKPYLSVKLDSAKVPDLPLPRPLFEIWVYSPRVEGVHLRGGKIARGGIRWSDRREDFRTEVLGLMKAQTVKNAVIVPVGAKGGFVVKRPSSTDLMNEVVECYKTLISGLLDLTDNISDGAVVPPPSVVRYDGDDPYLVVAADKGTASFSDIANGVSADYGFWLGDAFASGGSEGYDHKQMGITARGAWESAKRHMRELGVDIQTTDFTVCGIGDMSGDVFGNAMLLSEHIRLVAAFDHRDIFIDPDPDAATGFAERARLFALPRSSWADYDPSLISAGGGVFSRASKSVPISERARVALDIEATDLTPQELIRAILSAPVDLLFNGGIGTYVKATSETHADVGDRGSEPLRIDASALRVKAVVEGGNLGLTQLARIEYALAGGRIYTDAIDNSAGVNCSDHEVNIKILLDAQVASGAMTGEERNELLHAMTEEVAQLVLQDNYSQTRVLAIANAQAASLLGVHARYIDALESSGRLNSRLERLPDDTELKARATARVGLTTPEFAVLLAYTKLTLGHELLESDVPEDPYLSRELAAYFPGPIQERFAEGMKGHPLAREIVATAITNGVVNRAGITFAYRMEQETGAPPSELVRAHRAAREIFAMREVWSQIERLDNVIPADLQTTLHLETRRVIERAVRWLVRTRSPIDVAEVVRDFTPGIAQISAILDEVLTGSERTDVGQRRAAFEKSGVPPALARRVAALNTLFAGLDIVDVATRTKAPIDVVAGIYFRLGEQLELSWLRARITELPRADRWQSLARAALRDDAFAVHAQLVADVLRVAPSQQPRDAVAAWTKRRSGRLERGLRRLAEIRASGITDLATLSIAVREVKDLLAGRDQ